jgi:hypothetical protein
MSSARRSFWCGRIRSFDIQDPTFLKQLLALLDVVTKWSPLVNRCRNYTGPTKNDCVRLLRPSRGLTCSPRRGEGTSHTRRRMKTPAESASGPRAMVHTFSEYSVGIRKLGGGIVGLRWAVEAMVGRAVNEPTTEPLSAPSGKPLQIFWRKSIHDSVLAHVRRIVRRCSTGGIAATRVGGSARGSGRWDATNSCVGRSAYLSCFRWFADIVFVRTGQTILVRNRIRFVSINGSGRRKNERCPTLAFQPSMACIRATEAHFG